MQSYKIIKGGYPTGAIVQAESSDIAIAFCKAQYTDAGFDITAELVEKPLTANYSQVVPGSEHFEEIDHIIHFIEAYHGAPTWYDIIARLNESKRQGYDLRKAPAPEPDVKHNPKYQMNNNLEPCTRTMTILFQYKILINEKETDLIVWAGSEEKAIEYFKKTTGFVGNVSVKFDRAIIPECIPYQKCPKCDGQGSVSKPPYVAGDVHEWSSSSASSFVCNVCNGAKIIPMIKLIPKTE